MTMEASWNWIIWAWIIGAPALWFAVLSMQK
jgi:hypothetical protein